MNRVGHSRSWQTFLRLTPPNVDAKVPPLDSEWLASRAISPFAPQLWCQLRDEVLPLVRKLEKRRGLEWYFFLLHDSSNGAPDGAKAGDEYIHLHLQFKKPTRLVLFRDVFSPWEGTKPIDYGGGGFGGVDESTIVGGADAARRMIAYQSEWVLRLVELHKSDADITKVMRQARQYLHFFANMLQIKVVG